MANTKKLVAVPSASDALGMFHPAVRDWFEAVFRGSDSSADSGLAGDCARRVDADPRADGNGQNSGRIFVVHQSDHVRLRCRQSTERCRVLYISPIKALAVDVERNLRAPLVGIAQAAQRLETPISRAVVSIRTGDTPQAERARFARHPADILITTPESLYLLLTSNARDALRSIEVVVIDEIHALVPTQTRIASGAFVGAAAAHRWAADSAHRTVGDAAAAGRGRPLSRRSGGPARRG